MSAKSYLKVLIANLVVTAATFCVIQLAMAPRRAVDYGNRYEPVARQIVAGNGITDLEGKPAIYYPPGHAIYLASVFAISNVTRLPESWVLDSLSLLLHASIGLGLFVLARRFTSTGAAWIAALLWATYFPAHYGIALAGSEVSFAPLVLAAFALSLTADLSSKTVGIIVGILLGLSMLVRPFAILLPVTFSGLILNFVSKSHSLTPTLSPTEGEGPDKGNGWRVRIAAVGCLLLGTILAIAPWELWMFQQTGGFQPLSTIGRPSVIDGLTYGLPSPQRVAVDVRPKALEIMESVKIADIDGQLDSIGHLARWLIATAWEAPMGMMQLIGAKVCRTWYATDSHRWEGPLLGLQIPYLLAALCGAILAWQGGPRRRQVVLSSVVMIGYFWIMTVAVLSILRYMIPVMPVVILLSAPLWEKLWFRQPSVPSPPRMKRTRGG